jgi:hypothetical protein
MRRSPLAWLLVGLAALSSSAEGQTAMLEPPANHYFISQGSWGQKYANQWGIHRIGFDSSPQSAWRLVKRSSTPVVVAIIDTGLDWNHKNIDWESLWRNPQNASGSTDKAG